LGLYNVSGVVRDVSDGVVQRIRWGYATYPTGFRTGSEGFGTGSTRRWTYPLGLYNVSDGVRRWYGAPIRGHYPPKYVN